MKESSPTDRVTGSEMIFLCCRLQLTISPITIYNDRGMGDGMMLQIGICDDDHIFLDRAGKCLEVFFRERNIRAEIYFFDSAESLMSGSLRSGHELNVLFLDIELGKSAADGNGISVGRNINQMMPGCQIIFVTNYNEYSMDVYEVEHRGFIIKSEFENRFERALELLVKQSRLMAVNVKGQNVIYSLADICYIERGRRSCRLIMADSGREENPVINQSFEEICGRIGNRSFVRCHNSYMVNLCHVRTYVQDGFLMSSGDRIPISRRYRKAVRDQFMEWQGKWV